MAEKKSQQILDAQKEADEIRKGLELPKSEKEEVPKQEGVVDLEGSKKAPAKKEVKKEAVPVKDNGTDEIKN